MMLRPRIRAVRAAKSMSMASAANAAARVATRVRPNSDDVNPRSRWAISPAAAPVMNRELA